MTGFLPKGHKTTGAKTGQPEKAEDNGQATEATKPVKPNLRTTRVKNQPEKQNPTLNRNSQTQLAGRSGKDESTQPQPQQKPKSAPNANPKEPVTKKAGRAHHLTKAKPCHRNVRAARRQRQH